MNRAEVGGKAFNLHILKQKGHLVPPFITIPASFIESTLNIKKWRQIFLNADEFSSVHIESIRKSVEKAIASFDGIIDKALSQFSGRVIVRSSSSQEDNVKDSFAGIYESEVAEHTRSSLIDAIQKVILGFFSERARTYLKLKKIQVFPSISLILQEFIEGEASGVLFSSFTYQGRRGMFISASKGNASHVVLGHKAHHLFLHSETKPLKRSFPINKKQIQSLIALGKELEQQFHMPQDIEWTFHEGRLYILQTRPITTSKHLRVWDNSNISESYSGIVLPLTASFAREIYKVVYIDVARTSGVSIKTIREQEEIFENLLGFFFGRFYYNMHSWYKMLALFPGFERNKRNFKHMISARSQFEFDATHQKNVSFTFKTLYYPRALVRYFFFQETVKKFKKEIWAYYQKLPKDLEELDMRELIDLYYQFRNNLLYRWSLAVDNDFLAMTFFGALKKFCERSRLDQSLLDFISHIPSLASAEQVYMLERLGKEFVQHSKLVNLAKKKRYMQCHNEIYHDQKYNALKKGLDYYFRRYGGRFAYELRLEAEDLDSIPDYIIKLLMLYSNSSHRGEVIEARVQLGFYRNIIFEFLLKKTRMYIKQREELRLLRSQAFQHVRKLFRAIGRICEQKQILRHKEDIFYLEVDEIKRYIEGSSSSLQLQEVADLRRKEYSTFKNKELNPTFITEGAICPAAVPLENKKKNKSISRGEGCSPGVVTGKTTILTSFKLPRNRYEIIVAKNTDPGWTPLLGLCKGMIVEQGGLLSHAAIVSRELQVPCIIGVRDATSIFKDGQTVTINGQTGEIIVHE